MSLGHLRQLTSNLSEHNLHSSQESVTFIVEKILTDCFKQNYFISNKYKVMKENMFYCYEPRNTDALGITIKGMESDS
jgi:hypothetical protein